MNMNRKLLYLLTSLAVLMIWGIGIYYGQFVESNYSSVSVRLPEATITKQDVLTALENEETKGSEDIPAITAWKQIEDQSFEYPELGTKADLSVIEFWGDMEQILPIQLVLGSILTAEDESGCVIDEEAAYRLFRTTDAVGRFLTYRNKSYCIRGVIRTKQEVILIPVPEEDSPYSNLELVYADKERGEQYVRDFMQQNGLGEEYTIVEGCYYAKLIQMLCGLPAWLLGVAILYQLIREGRKRLSLQLWDTEFSKHGRQSVLIGRKKEVELQHLSAIQVKVRILLQVLGFVIFFCAVLFLLRWITEFRIFLPERWLPTRWSDFSFWTERWQEGSEQWEALEYLVPVTKDILLFQALRRCAYGSLIALAAVVILVIHGKFLKASGRGIEVSLIAIGLEGVAALILYHTGFEFVIPRAYLSMLPFYLFFTGTSRRFYEYYV